MHIVPTAVKTAIASAAGAGLFLAASAAHAVGVLTPANIVVPATTGGIYINVLNGAAGTATATAGWDINPWGTTGLGFFSPAAPAGGVYALSGTGTVANLALGSIVNAASTFGSGTSTNIAQWNLNSTNNYFGFRFNNETGGTTHYGFAQLRIGSTITDRSVIGWGIETTPNLAITVAAIPEPGTYGLMGLGLAAVALAARRRKQAA